MNEELQKQIAYLVTLIQKQDKDIAEMRQQLKVDLQKIESFIKSKRGLHGN